MKTIIIISTLVIFSSCNSSEPYQHKIDEDTYDLIYTLINIYNSNTIKEVDEILGLTHFRQDEGYREHFSTTVQDRDVYLPKNPIEFHNIGDIEIKLLHVLKEKNHEERQKWKEHQLWYNSLYITYKNIKKNSKVIEEIKSKGYVEVYENSKIIGFESKSLPYIFWASGTEATTITIGVMRP